VTPADSPRAGHATVARVDFGSCSLIFDDGTLADATVRGVVRGRNKALGNAAVVGDRVRVEPSSERLVVMEVDPRRTSFSRRAAGSSPREQVVAANIDQVVVVASVEDPEFKAGFADRVIGQAHHDGLPAVLAINKSDLCPESESRAIVNDYARAGVHGRVVSAHAGTGIADLRADCVGKRSLFVGHSGVGKSSLLNAMVPALELLAGQVNPKTGKGRHTTTAAWLVRPEPGFELIDTPGVRGFGLWGIGADDLERAYREFEPFIGHCRFSDCRHEREPGCAIQDAVEAGTIARRRYESFRKLREEIRMEGGAY
jgi:ribosome biogenesis GTPase